MGIQHIFVYGTLKQGMSNHSRFCGDALTIDLAVTTGRLYHLTHGFPAMFDAPDGQVFGEVMTFPVIDEKLIELDSLEGFNPGFYCNYLRVIKEVTILSSNRVLSAWTYVYAEDRMQEIKHSAFIVQSGNWKKRIETIQG